MFRIDYHVSTKIGSGVALIFCIGIIVRWILIGKTDPYGGMLSYSREEHPLDFWSTVAVWGIFSLIAIYGLIVG